MFDPNILGVVFYVFILFMPLINVEKFQPLFKNVFLPHSQFLLWDSNYMYFNLLILL